ncbi:hypothetical protein TorRG33x02_351790, partial [Trema orientale]
SQDLCAQDPFISIEVSSTHSHQDEKPLLMLINKLTRSRPMSLDSLLRLLLLNHVYISLPLLMLIRELIMSQP